MSSESQAMKRFYDSVGEHYPEEESVYHTLRGLLRKRFVLDWIRNRQGSLLEIGTNRGMYLQYYDGGLRVGADLSLTALKQAARAKSVHYLVADAERLYCFKSSSLDNVLCSEVIEHCMHPQDIMNGIAHVLVPGGEALITTPNYRGERPQWLSIGVMREYGVRSEWENEQYFHTAYRPEELENMACQAGLHVLDSGTFEKDVKYAAKIPAALLLSGRWINRLFRSSRLAAVNEKFFQDFQVFIYQCCKVCGLNRVLLKFVKEGVRTFIRVRRKF